MGKLAGGGAVVILFPILVVVIFLGGTGACPVSQAVGTVPAVRALKPGAIPAAYVDLLTRAGTLCPLVTPALLAAQIETESGFDPRAGSSAGAAGIAQIMPAEWQAYGRDENGDGTADVGDPADAIPAMARIECANADALAAVPGDKTTNMVAAYDAGTGAVRQYGGVPPFPETQAYVKQVAALAADYTAPAPVQGPGGTVAAGQWAPGVASLVSLVDTTFGVTAGTDPDHHPDEGHAADFAYQQFPDDWTDGAPGVPGTGPQWQIAAWIAANLVDTGNAWYVGHHASIHEHGDPPGVWHVVNSQVGSSDPTQAHMNHIHVSWPRWFGQVGPSAWPPDSIFTGDPPGWTSSPVPAAAVPAGAVPAAAPAASTNLDVSDLSIPAGAHTQTGVGFPGASAGMTFPALLRIMTGSGLNWAAASTYRPGDGAGSYHGVGQAVDFVATGANPADSPQLLAIDQFWAARIPHLSELIYTGPGGVCAKNGVQVPCTAAAGWGQAVVDEHHNHVHVAASPQLLAGLAGGAQMVAGTAGAPVSCPAAAAAAGNVHGPGGAAAGPPGAVNTDGYALPLAPRYMPLGRTDQGVDIEAAPVGATVYSMCPGVVTVIGRDVPNPGDPWSPGGFGPNYPIVRCTAGGLTGQAVYYGHVGVALVQAGQTVAAGQPIATLTHVTDVGPPGQGHIEIGFDLSTGVPANRGPAMRAFLISLGATFSLQLS